MKSNTGPILREITPLSEQDCFIIFPSIKQELSYPVHVHSEFELKLIENAAGAKRIVGDNEEEIGNIELVLIANPNLGHGWLNHNCKSGKIKEITIQFHNDLFNQQLLNRNQFRSINNLIDKAAYGVTFSHEDILNVKDRVNSLIEYEGGHSVLKLMGILYDLSLSESIRELSGRNFIKNTQNYDNRRIEKVYNYLRTNYNQDVRLSDVAGLIGMTDVSFSRFIKQRTGRNFIDSLNDIRLGHATRMLLDSTECIADIAVQCGFNNLSNFNRIFKKKKSCTPSEYRENNKEAKLFF